MVYLGGWGDGITGGGRKKNTGGRVSAATLFVMIIFPCFILSTPDGRREGIVPEKKMLQIVQRGYKKIIPSVRVPRLVKLSKFWNDETLEQQVIIKVKIHRVM